MEQEDNNLFYSPHHKQQMMMSFPNNKLGKENQISLSQIGNENIKKGKMMQIETTGSNQLVGSVSTQASNGTINSINLSKESNNINIINTNQNQNQNQINIIFEEKKNPKHKLNLQKDLNQINNMEIEEEEKKGKEKIKEKEIEIFKFDFVSTDDFLKCAGEYINEIYANLLLDEQKLEFKPIMGYMNYQPKINEKMRMILVDWLVENHFNFRLKSETLFQTIWIIDTYLSNAQITSDQFQLLGVAALLISCKSREIYYHPLNRFIEITDFAFNKDQLLSMESHILKVLKFNILSPTSNDFYKIIAKVFNFNKQQFFVGKYFLESSLIDYQILKYSPSVIAVACAYIVMKFFSINNYKSLYSNNVIKENYPEKVIKFASRELCFLVKDLSKSTLRAVKDKYSLPEFLKVAQFCEQH